MISTTQFVTLWPQTMSLLPCAMNVLAGGGREARRALINWRLSRRAVGSRAMAGIRDEEERGVESKEDSESLHPRSCNCENSALFPGQSPQ